MHGNPLRGVPPRPATPAPRILKRSPDGSPIRGNSPARGGSPVRGDGSPREFSSLGLSGALARRKNINDLPEFKQPSGSQSEEETVFQSKHVVSEEKNRTNMETLMSLPPRQPRAKAHRLQRQSRRMQLQHPPLATKQRGQRTAPQSEVQRIGIESPKKAKRKSFVGSPPKLKSIEPPRSRSKLKSENVKPAPKKLSIEEEIDLKNFQIFSELEEVFVTLFGGELLDIDVRMPLSVRLTAIASIDGNPNNPRLLKSAEVATEFRACLIMRLAQKFPHVPTFDSIQKEKLDQLIANLDVDMILLVRNLSSAKTEDQKAAAKSKFHAALLAGTVQLWQNEYLKSFDLNHALFALTNQLKKDFDPSKAGVGFYRGNSEAINELKRFSPFCQPIAEQLLDVIRNGLREPGRPPLIVAGGHFSTESDTHMFMVEMLHNLKDVLTANELPAALKTVLSVLFTEIDKLVNAHGASFSGSAEELEKIRNDAKLNLLRAIYLRTITPSATDVTAEGDERMMITRLAGAALSLINGAKKEGQFAESVEAVLKPLAAEVEKFLREMLVRIDADAQRWIPGKPSE